MAVRIPSMFCGWFLGLNLPNQLTLIRMVMAGVFVVLMAINTVTTLVMAYILFTAAVITDYYDGKIARERNLITKFGKLLDPVADKILLSAAFIMLMAMPDLELPAWAVIIVIAREFMVTGARSFAASEGIVIQASESGKNKTALQMVYVFAFLLLVVVGRFLMQWDFAFADLYQDLVRLASFWGIMAVALYTFYSGVHFLWVNWRQLLPDQQAE
ncbi:MAG: CDP-diacylglycerol--glycerol-3-phosphate 3-phosphatidyltransferase [Candidatus Hydrogenedentota bacterium]